MKLIVSRLALKQLRALPRMAAKMLLDAMRQVAESHPQRMSYATEMVGMPGVWRARKGNYRAISRIGPAEIVVISVGDTKDAYDG